MKMMRNVLLIVLFFLFLIMGCSGSKKAAENAVPVVLVSPPSDKAVVYVLRPVFVGALLNFKFEVDGVLIGKTKGKQYIYTFVDPGNHTLVSIAENKSELPVVLEAGKTYFFEQEVKMGILKARNKLVRLDKIDAKIKLQKCKLPKDFVAPN